MLSETLPFLLSASLAAFIIGLSKGGLSMLGILSVPLLSLSMPPLAAAALLLPLYIVSDVVGVALYRRRYSGRNVAILGIAGVAGVALGGATASFVSDRAVLLLVGLIGLAFCIDIFLKRKRVLPPKAADLPRGAFWGTLAGFTSFVSHAGGPPYQVYVLPQRLEKRVFAGTTTIVFAIVNAAKLVPYIALGELDAAVFAESATLIPVALVGTIAGWKLVGIIPERAFYAFVQTTLFLVSLKLVWDAVVG